MKRPALLLSLLALAWGCGDDRDPPASEAEVGGERTDCETPGSHSVRLSAHSCVCEDGYTWCSEGLDEFDCCLAAEDSESETGEPITPEHPCGEEQLEQLVCVEGPIADDPTGSAIWACSGEAWVEVASYATFACMADGHPFAYGCVDDQPPSFLCGFGQGSSCDPLDFASLCVDEDIIDTCVWGRRTVDRCSRLCAELEAFGPGYSTGACSQLDPAVPAVCECG